MNTPTSLGWNWPLIMATFMSIIRLNRYRVTSVRHQYDVDFGRTKREEIVCQVHTCYAHQSRSVYRSPNMCGKCFVHVYNLLNAAHFIETRYHAIHRMACSMQYGRKCISLFDQWISEMWHFYAWPRHHFWWINGDCSPSHYQCRSKYNVLYI